jgi:hypothetical protein
MAKASGVGRTTIQHIWRAFGLQPHQSETFKRSNDPVPIEKVRDIRRVVRESARTRSCSSVPMTKHRFQTKDRTQPLLPMQPSPVERRMHDYKLQGTTTLFAALDVATSKGIS